MPGNSAGLIRAHRTITMIASQDTYTMNSMYASGTAPTSATSLIYPNDRYLAADVAGFTKFTFTVGTTGTVTTPSISVYYTNDPVTAAGLNSFAGTGQWVLAAAPGEQAGGGSVVNPMTGPTTYMQFFAPMLAYRITTSAYAGGGTVLVNVIALP